MIMADILAIFLVIIGLIISFNAFWLLMRGLWPQKVSCSQAQCNTSLLRSFFWGIPISVVSFFVIVAVFQSGAKPLGFMFFFLYIMFSHVGVAGFVTMIGTRLREGKSDSLSTLYGGLVFAFACVLPLLGWFILFPVATIIGCGTSTSLMFSRKTTEAEVQNLETSPAT